MIAIITWLAKVAPMLLDLLAGLLLALGLSGCSVSWAWQDANPRIQQANQPSAPVEQSQDESRTGDTGLNVKPVSPR